MIVSGIQQNGLINIWMNESPFIHSFIQQCPCTYSPVRKITFPVRKNNISKTWNIIPHCDKDCEGKTKGLWVYLIQDLIWSRGSGMASLRRWCLRWDLNYVQELLGREAVWEWWAGVGRKSMPGRGISMCKGRVVGGTVTLSGHSNEDWWGGVQEVS